MVGLQNIQNKIAGFQSGKIRIVCNFTPKEALQEHHVVTGNIDNLICIDKFEMTLAAVVVIGRCPDI